MNPEQKTLARHALGLDGRRRTSYRNRFFVHVDTPAWHEWMAMCAAGEAERDDWRSDGSGHRFSLTRAGGDLALDHGESLDLEDFP